MKQLLTALMLCSALLLGAKEINLYGNFAETQKNGLPKGWNFIRAKDYQPLPKFEILRENSANILHFSDIAGKYGFGWESAVRIRAKAGERVTITAKVKGKGRGWFTVEATSASGKWSGGFPKQRFPLKEEWNEAKVELRIVDFKKIPTGKITVLFGADNGSELFLSDLKMVSAAQ